MAESIAELLKQVFSDPPGVIESATAQLASADGAVRVELLRVLGNATRELQRIDESVSYLRAAVAGAVDLGDTDLEGLCSMSLAASLSYSGNFEESLRTGRRAVDLLSGDDRITALSQMAGLLQRAGRNDEALRGFDEALRLAESSKDETIRGSLWTNRGVLLGWAGEIDNAEADTRRALDLFQRLGRTKRAADTRYNLAWLAVRRGDLVEAFQRFEDADQVYESLGVSNAAMAPDRSEALLAAGLTHEAVTLAEQAASELRAQGDDVDLAEALMLVARAALLGEDNDRAASASSEASHLFSAQDRSGWWAAAASLNVEGRIRAGTADEGDIERIDAVIEATRSAGLATACAEARVVAAELAAERDEWAVARTHLDSIERTELGLAARCRADLVSARELAASGRDLDAIAACAAAVDEFAELTAELGGTELRAHVALHVAQLVGTGLALAVRRDDPVLAFEWSERQRAAALASPPVRPPDDAELAADLDRLRAALTQLDAELHDGTRHGGSTAVLGSDPARLLDRIRRRARLGRRAGAAIARPGTVDDVIAGGVAAWVSFIEVDERLAALRVVDGRVTIVDLGETIAVQRQAGTMRSVLTMHLTALGRGVTRDPAPVMASAAETDARLLQALDLPDGDVVISPIAGLHDLPWGLLPSLRSRPFVIAPSVALWTRCREAPAGAPVRGVAVAGPGLPFADVEVARVAARYRAAAVYAGAGANVADVSAAMTGADVAHVACHGRLSRENPMFSSLLLGDGPMFVYDLERIEPPPRIVVLSACHAGSHATPTGREILGLTASLLAMGPRAVIAATVPIPDTLATVDVMAELHDRLATGARPADALLAIREADPVVGGAFASHGAH
jgi:tetratricopeptide (TPR) repeat protein